MIQKVIQKTDIKALCFVLSVAVASLAIVVVKKNEKVKAFRLEAAEYQQKISALEAKLAAENSTSTIVDVQDALNEISAQTEHFKQDISELTNSLKNVVGEATNLATEEGGAFDGFLNNVKDLIQRFQSEVPQMQKEIETLANTIENKVSNSINEIDQQEAPMPEAEPMTQPLNE